MIVTTNENSLWFIISKGEEVQYGEIPANCTSESIYPIHTYASEDKWKLELLNLGIDIEEINKTNSPQEPEPYVEPTIDYQQFFK